MSPEIETKSPRSLWVMSGEKETSVKAIQMMAEVSVNDSLVVTYEPELYKGIHTISYKQANELLGQEKKLVIVEIQDVVAVDAIAAVAGLVVRGGYLVFSLPVQSEWQNTFKSNFSRRFLSYLQNYKRSVFVNANDNGQLVELLDGLKKGSFKSEFSLTQDQIRVIEKVKVLTLSEDRDSLVVISDRGRGKSTSLGVVASQLLKNHKLKILITAPSFKSCEVTFIHAQKALSGKKMHQACLQYEQSEFRFMAPDELLQSDYQADIVLVDEAASIPLPILKQILQKHKKTVFVSTVHGYEGTGRGFSVKFCKVLDAISDHWQQIEMKTPVRWDEDDELEAWLFRLLCLDAELSENSGNVSDAFSLTHLSVRKVNSDELMNNEALLREVFALLVLAHYRTRPSDLQRLLDDDLQITIAEYNGQIVGVLLSGNEGGFDQELSVAIYRGERRPQGHLLAQTLTYHCGAELAATNTIHRIMRVVVHPLYQGQGIGSQLVNHLERDCLQQGVDILGASFGLTKALKKFWEINNFNLVRIGFKREQSSGERAAVFVKALTASGKEVTRDCRKRFVSHFPQLHKTLLSDVDITIDEVEANVSNQNLSAQNLKDIESFIKYSRGYEISIAGVNKWSALHLSKIKNDMAIKDYYNVINLVVLMNMDWKSVANSMGLTGKKQAQDLFKEAVVYLWNKVSSDETA